MPVGGQPRPPGRGAQAREGEAEVPGAAACPPALKEKRGAWEKHRGALHGVGALRRGAGEATPPSA